ncbi:hypothetical protein [Paenibacillus ginsengarvi]|nr:hypothetical protein [Paenibacillus ginsengarvi]
MPGRPDVFIMPGDAGKSKRRGAGQTGALEGAAKQNKRLTAG